MADVAIAAGGVTTDSNGSTADVTTGMTGTEDDNTTSDAAVSADMLSTTMTSGQLDDSNATDTTDVTTAAPTTMAIETTTSCEWECDTTQHQCYTCKDGKRCEQPSLLGHADRFICPSGRHCWAWFKQTRDVDLMQWERGCLKPRELGDIECGLGIEPGSEFCIYRNLTTQTKTYNQKVCSMCCIGDNCNDKPLIMQDGATSVAAVAWRTIAMATLVRLTCRFLHP
ncbi:PREDICTED: uncharacterized protein LOC106806991 [Priapulus caudatus]|uniref:Uncharacterized protein LOC106806991 n=1 Tax=Priapulus caudatus TaxID=37621 RepID=A0ABM1DXK1_PRICU|nr:PREDICTED: uncharacterized protein LOC106806991 [Priapulus caudatus]